MIRVHGIVVFLQKHWKGKEVNWDLIKKSALVHDLGNIVKFNLDKYPQFLGSEQKNMEYWKKVQREMIEKYGRDDHEATRQMLTEINVDPKIVQGILGKSFHNAVEIKNSHNWLTKILLYADLRAMPFGVVPLSERLDDVRDRMPQYTSRADFEDLVGAALDIEKQIQHHLNVEVSEIADDSIDTDENWQSVTF